MQPVWAIGLMSGTSMDGVDAALIKTDGQSVFEFGPACSLSYKLDFRNRFRRFLGQQTAPAEIINEFTDINASAVEAVLEESGLDRSDINVIGFHGQTLFHDAPAGITVQVGNASRLAKACGVEVVSEFRVADVAAGGQGAPFAPLYHRALAKGLEGPLVVLNLGGVANVTYINDDEILAFDTGPASALLDDWVLSKTGMAYDSNGHISRRGTVDQSALSHLLSHSYFDRPPPKSLDRDDFSSHPVRHLSLEDGAATLAAFTVQSIQKSLEHMQVKPRRWLVTGGGRHNSYFMEQISKAVGTSVEPVEAVGWRGDELEAEAFAFLAVRSLLGLPLSVPGTTGVKTPMCGGVRYPCAAA